MNVVSNNITLIGALKGFFLHPLNKSSWLGFWSNVIGWSHTFIIFWVITKITLKEDIKGVYKIDISTNSRNEIEGDLSRWEVSTFLEDWMEECLEGRGHCPREVSQLPCRGPLRGLGLECTRLCEAESELPNRLKNRGLNEFCKQRSDFLVFSSAP